MRSLLLFAFIIRLFCGIGQEPYNQNGKWGLKNGTDWIVKPSYDKMYPSKNGHFLVKKDKLYGLINAKGEVVFEPKFSSLFMVDDLSLVFAVGGEINYIQGELVNGKYGLMTLSGNLIIEPRFHRIYESHGLLNVQVNDNWGHWGVLDLTGKVLLDTIYPSFSFDMRPHSPISILSKSQVMIKDGKSDWKFLNLKTKRSRIVKYGDFWGPYFDGDYARISQGRKDFLIDKSGKRVGQTFFAVKPTKGDYFYAKTTETGNWSVYNTRGQKQKELSYIKSFDRFTDNYGLVETRGGQNGIISTQGKLSYKTDHELKMTESEGFFIEKIDDRYTIIDANGQQKMSPTPLILENYYEEYGLILARNKDTKEQHLYKLETGQILDLIKVRSVRKQGDLLRVQTYGEASYYVNKQAKVLASFKPKYEVEQKYGKRNKNGLKEKNSGVWVVEPNYNYGSVISENRFYFGQTSQSYPKGAFIVAEAGDNGLVMSGYEFVKKVTKRDGTSNLLVTQKGKQGVLDHHMRLIIPFKYDSVAVKRTHIAGYQNGESIIHTTGGTELAKNKVVYKNMDEFVILRDNKESSEYYVYNKSGKELLRGQLQYIMKLKNGIVEFYHQDEKVYYLLDIRTGKVLKTKYYVNKYLDAAIVGGNGAYEFRKKRYGKRKIGVMDLSGKVIIEPKYSNGKLDPNIYYLQGKSDLLVKDITAAEPGKSYQSIELLVKSYDKKRKDHGHVYGVNEGDGYFLADANFKPLSQEKFKYVEGLDDAIVVQKIDGTYGLVNKKGESITKEKYITADWTWNFVILETADEKLRVFNGNGERIVDREIDGYSIDDFVTDLELIIVEIDEEEFLYDYYGALIYGPVDEFIGDWNELYYEVNLEIRKGDKYGLINLYGSQSALFEPIYDEIDYYEFDQLIAVLKKGDKYGIINLEGVEVLPFEYDKIEIFKREDDEENVGIVIQGDKSFKLSYTLELIPD